MNLDELERLAMAATPGPWSTEKRSGNELDRQKFDSHGPCLVMALEDCEDHPIADCSCNHSCRTFGEPEANAAFIASANPAVILALIERVREAEAIVFAITGDPHIGHIEAARRHMEKHNAKP